MKIKLMLLLSSLGLVACSSGQKELDELCRKDAGTVIYKQVEADGYYDDMCSGPCWNSLFSKRFKYKEIYHDGESNYYIPEKGYWHIYIG